MHIRDTVETSNILETFLLFSIIINLYFIEIGIENMGVNLVFFMKFLEKAIGGAAVHFLNEPAPRSAPFYHLTELL